MKKLIDLTHVLDASSSPRKFSMERVGAETVNPNVIRKSGQWYIMTNIEMVSHLATHVEVPFHLYPDGMDLAQMPLDVFSGEGLLLDFSDIQARVPITKERCQKAIEEAGGIHRGDIVLCNLGFADRYGTPEYGMSPFFSQEAMELLVSSGMKLMGVDAGGVEIPGSEEHVNHAQLFSHGIPLIENVAHLGQLPHRRFLVSAFPYPVKGLEAFLVRVVAYVD